MPIHPCRAVAAALTISSLAHAGAWKAFRDLTVQDFGHQWSTVSDPHNHAYVYDDPTPGNPDRWIGRTNYKYRVMTREVTVREWFDFVQTYAPYVHSDARASQQFIGTNGFIQYQGLSGGVPQYSMEQQFGDVPIQVGWRFAARYANYLHNDQADAAWAFETGAYDTSTFGTTQNEMGANVLTDQRERSEGARFWIPFYDEWTKAGHWDPDRYGEGEGGWWQYPTTGDTAPIPGAPDQGGQTNGGTFPVGQARPIDAGSFPDELSPWGLLDVSGGAHEWLEDIWSPLVPNRRLTGGSSIYLTALDPALYDVLGRHRPLSPTSFGGVRLASVVPSPGAIAALFALGATSCRRRRNAV